MMGLFLKSGAPRFLRTAAVAALSLSLVARPAAATTVQSSFTVTATVLTACLISSLPLAFGNYDPTSTAATTNYTTVTATCTLSAPYTIALNDGTGSGASATGGTQGRKMTIVSGTSTLGYNLYQDNGYATVWGSTTGLTFSATGSGLAQTYNVYGRIPAQQAVAAGSYLDTVTATLTF